MIKRNLQILLIVANALLLRGTFGNQCGAPANISNYFIWRNTLYCPDECCGSFIGYDSADECCTCKAKPCWEIGNIDIEIVCGVKRELLYLEYIDIHGNTNVVNPMPGDIYELINTNGMMKRLPSNLCDFADSLVKLDFTGNFIEDIDDLKCLNIVDSIHLDRNNVKHISNETFTNMKKLRVLTMTYNNIERLEPYVLKIAENNINYVDLSYNSMESADITNIIRPGPFCKLNISHSDLNDLTNDLNYTLDKNVMHGPGDIDLQHSHLTSYVNFSGVGVPSFSELTQYFDGTIKIDSTSIGCDCGLYPMFNSLGDDVGKYWPNLEGQDFVCNNPERMKNISLSEILANKMFEQLTCDIENCPYNGICHCLDVPRYNKIIVNCTNAGLKTFPDVMPVGYWNNFNVELILVNNEIQNIPQRDYMDRLVMLDIRGNDISQITPNAIESINRDTPVHMNDQQLSNLISEFYYKNPKLIQFGENPVKCDCSNLWIGDWARTEASHTDLMCETEKGHILPALATNYEQLGCSVDVLPLSVVVGPIGAFLSLFLLGILTFVIFKHDLIILLRRFRRRPPSEPPLYDLFVSFCAENEDSFYFVDSYLHPALNDSGYIVFIPWFHLDYGGDRDTAVAEALNKCKTFIVVLCSEYLTEYYSRFEFDNIWDRFKDDNDTQIIVINLDNLNGNDIRDKRMRAFRRTKTDISFRHRKGKLMDRLLARIGPPSGLQPPSLNGQVSKVPLQDETEDIDRTIVVAPKDEAMEKYFSLSVHERLNLPQPTSCNCKYRKCYLHAGALDMPKVKV